MTATKLFRTFLAFAGVGAVATGIQYAVLTLMVELLDAAPAASSAVGFGLSSIANYILNYRLTFRSTARHAHALPKFLAVACVGLALNTGLMALLAERAGMYYLLAQVLTTGLVLVWNFAANLLWSFREPSVGPAGTLPCSPKGPTA